ncbi:hypothetical protein Tco_1428118 [Tanacetum coccineum]
MAVKGTRKRSYESDDDLSVVSRPFKISCLEKVDEKQLPGHEADDLLDQESCFERRRRLYAGDTYTDDEAEYSRYWDEALSSDDSKRVFVEQELSCEKSGNITGYENLDEQECSCEKSGNVTGDENVDEECSYGNSCDVAGKFSDNTGAVVTNGIPMIKAITVVEPRFYWMEFRIAC